MEYDERTLNDDTYPQYDDELDNKSGQDRSLNKESNSVLVPYFDIAEYTTTAKEGDVAVLDCNAKNAGGNIIRQWFM